ncbi:MAG: type II secretion system protein [Phycisphaerae bacterium]
MRNHGFTLVEILIVVIILGILAAVVIPQFAGASGQSRAATLRKLLQTMRSQIALYEAEHADGPGYVNGGTPSLADADTIDLIEKQMTAPTNYNGQWSEAPPWDLGPYLMDWPTNPINGQANLLPVGPGEMAAPASDDHGWVYQRSTFTLKSGATGSDEDGVAFWDY